MKASKFESDKENDFEDKDIIMIARKFRRFLKKPSERRRFKDSKNKKKREEVGNYNICFERKSQIT